LTSSKKTKSGIKGPPTQGEQSDREKGSRSLTKIGEASVGSSVSVEFKTRKIGGIGLMLHTLLKTNERPRTNTYRPQTDSNDEE